MTTLLSSTPRSLVRLGIATALAVAGLSHLASPAMAATPACPEDPAGTAGYESGTGTSGDPYEIADSTQLDTLQQTPADWGCDFYLSANINMGGTTWATGIGTALAADFTGVFDGRGHVVSGLTIDAPGTDYVGLFGYLSGTVRNVGFSGNVTGADYVGGLVGYNVGVIETSYATGDVYFSAGPAGGLVGRHANGSVSDSYARGNVHETGTPGTGRDVGGLIGDDGTSKPVADSYATGTVEGQATYVGGLLGGAFGGITDSFWDTTTSGTPDGVGTNYVWPLSGVTGETTAGMQDITTFSNWSIAANWTSPKPTWGICATVNDGYPYLTAFYASDPCGSDPVAVGGAVPDWPVFTFQTPGGGECTEISPQHPRLNSWFTLPDADAPCFIKGSVITGWSIPGQDWAFAPGRRVWVVDSQTFTSVLEYEWVTVEYDSNVDAKDACLVDGVDLPVADRTGITHIPRGVITEQPLWKAPVCAPAGWEFTGWTTDNPHQDPRVLPKDGTMPAPAVNSDGDAANTIHLYAIWKWIG